MPKAFNRVYHYKRSKKLSKRGAPDGIIRILTYWYAKKRIKVGWGYSLSASFGVSNGNLNECKTGCVIGKL